MLLSQLMRRESGYICIAKTDIDTDICRKAVFKINDQGHLKDIAGRDEDIALRIFCA